MDSTAEIMSAELRDELAESTRRRLINPADEPVRFHHLKAMGQSALHCFASFQSDREESLALRLGAGTHALTFGQPVVVWTGKVRNGKVWDAFKAEHAGKIILNQKEHAKSKAIADALRSHPIASRLLFGPDVLHEDTIWWEQDGLRRRSTPDARSKSHLVELKTTRCADPERFARDARFRGYHAQVADYRDAMIAANGYAPKDCYLIAVESVRPYAVTVFRLTDRALELGQRAVRGWRERFVECLKSNAWPSYCESIADFDVQDDADLELLFGDDDGEGNADE